MLSWILHSMFPPRCVHIKHSVLVGFSPFSQITFPQDYSDYLSFWNMFMLVSVESGGNLYPPEPNEIGVVWTCFSFKCWSHSHSFNVASRVTVQACVTFTCSCFLTVIFQKPWLVLLWLFSLQMRHFLVVALAVHSYFTEEWITVRLWEKSLTLICKKYKKVPDFKQNLSLFSTLLLAFRGRFVRERSFMVSL